jgi:hypothetical protein
MIDVYAEPGTFDDKHTLARDLASAVMRWRGIGRLMSDGNSGSRGEHD